jgi:hypothetical protein
MLVRSAYGLNISEVKTTATTAKRYKMLASRTCDIIKVVFIVKAELTVVIFRP